MLSANTLRAMSNTFIGDNNDLYSYKGGSDLVNFFNTNFGFEDTYYSGFPSRWAYVVDKFNQLLSQGKFDDFISLILSKQFIMKDKLLTDINAVEYQEKAISFVNELIGIDNYKLLRIGQDFKLIEQSSDLVHIGGGGFAEVFKSKSSGLIVKMLKDEFKSNRGITHRFKREFEITKSLSDITGIIDVIDFNLSDYSYTMPEAEKTLKQYIEEFEHPEPYKIKMIQQILTIMSHVHSRNIIHRDLSPNNVMLLNGQLIISDFGLGKDLDIFHSHRTVVTMQYGTFDYCAPEQFMQLKEGDKQSDVYSLGSLINFILTKNPRNNQHFLKSQVEKARNENPSLRYQDANQMLDSVQKAIEYYQNKERQAQVLDKVNSFKYDEDVESYINSLDSIALCNSIIDNSGMVAMIHLFYKDDDKRLVNILTLLEDSYASVCSKFTDYDDFGRIAHEVIKSNRTFVAMEIAARILYHVAYDINRFGMQRLVEDILNRGTDPMIETILKP